MHIVNVFSQHKSSPVMTMIEIKSITRLSLQLFPNLLPPFPSDIISSFILLFSLFTCIYSFSYVLTVCSNAHSMPMWFRGQFAGVSCCLPP